AKLEIELTAIELGERDQKFDLHASFVAEELRQKSFEGHCVGGKEIHHHRRRITRVFVDASLRASRAAARADAKDHFLVVENPNALPCRAGGARSVVTRGLDTRAASRALRHQ